MINITSQVTESILNSTESTTATSTTNTITTSSSSATFLTNNTSDTNNITTTTITTTTTNDKDIITINNVNAINEDLPAEEEKTCNLNMPTLTATLLTASTNIITTSSNNTDSANISIDSSDSSNSSGNPNLPSGRDISCIDLTEGDDDIEILTEKLTRPTKRRKRDNKTSPSSTSTSCSCSLRPHRNSLEIYRESSDLPLNSSRHSSIAPRTVHHHPPSLTPLPSISPPFLPDLSLQELISPPRSDSFIVDLAHSPPPSTSSSSNKNNSIDVLTESLPKRKNIPTPPPPEPARYKIVKCPICLEEDHKILAAGGEIVVTVCGHVYCKSCLQQAIKTNHFCPNCRKKLTQRSYHRIFL